VSIARIDTFADTSEPCKIIHWMRVISYNLVQELVYDRKRQTRIELFSDMLEEQIESKTPILSHDEPNDQNPENRLVLDESEGQREEYYKLMQKALDELLPEHKEIIWEWAIGTSVDDLAFKYRRTRSSVYKVIDRSKAKIKGYITRNFNGR